jgi:hypothetical protein
MLELGNARIERSALSGEFFVLADGGIESTPVIVFRHST